MDGDCINCGESGNWCRCDEEETEILYEARGLGGRSIEPTTDSELDNLPF